MEWHDLDGEHWDRKEVLCCSQSCEQAMPRLARCASSDCVQSLVQPSLSQLMMFGNGYSIVFDMVMEH